MESKKHDPLEKYALGSSVVAKKHRIHLRLNHELLLEFDKVLLRIKHNRVEVLEALIRNFIKDANG